MQKNYITKIEYQGDNQSVLLEIKRLRKYKENEWLTFLQAKNANLKIKKGEKGTLLKRVVTYIDAKTKEEKKAIRGFTVFNIEQTEAKK